MEENCDDKYGLERFLRAQEYAGGGYADALQEVKDGCKRTHWIWYIFPQIKGLGHSNYSKYFGINSLEEANAYLKHPILGERLMEITKELLKVENKTATDILGVIDARKVKSCMTLFDLISPHTVFNDMLEKYYGGRRCRFTLNRFSNQ